MATENEKTTKIEINIAGEILYLSVPFSKQSSVRHCESEINALYSEWRTRFPRKSNTEIIAMVAYQYASFYFKLKEVLNSLTLSMEDTSAELSRLLDEQPAKENDSL